LHRDALRRALRGLEMVGVFRREPDGRWALGEIGAVLRAGVPGSVRDYIDYSLHDGNWRAWQHVDQTLRSGDPSFAAANGAGFWDYMDAHADVGAQFHRAMLARTGMTAPQIAGALDLTGVETVVDIGGGIGILLAEVLAVAPGVRGVLFEAPSAIDAAREHLAARGLAERATVEAGSFFERVPDGLDAYLLKNVLHDWHDTDAGRILDVCRRAARDDARLWIVDSVVPDDAAPHPAKVLDLHMMVALGGRERSRSEWERLLADHGFELARVVPLPGPDAIVEARPV